MRRLFTKLLGVALLLFGTKTYAQEKGIEKFLATKKGYEIYHYPKVNQVFNFTIMNPGVVLVPAGGGVYMAGWKKWFVEPKKNDVPFALDFCEADTSFYFFTTNHQNSSLFHLKRNQKSFAFVKILDMPIGAYGLAAASKKVMWIWGHEDNSWCIWRYTASQLKLVLKTELLIKELVPLNDDNVVVATEHSIIKMGVLHSPEEIINMDSQIDGLAVHSDGTLFVSTDKGIIHYLSPDFVEDAEIVTYGIHGTLRRYRKSLYVLWQEDSQVLEIKL